MRITATATRTGVSVRKDGVEVKFAGADLRVTWKGYHGVNTDEAEALLEDEGLAPRTWIWNADKKHYVTLLVAL